MTMRKRYLLPIAAALMLTGCTTAEQVAAYKADAAEQEVILEQRVAFLEEAKADAALAGNPELVAKYEKKIQVAEALKGGVTTAVESLDKIFTEQGTLRQPEELIKAFDPVLPVGVGSIGLLIVGLIRSLTKQREWKKDFAELVGAIDDTKEDNAELAEAMHKAGESLRSRMPSATRAKIKSIRNGA